MLIIFNPVAGRRRVALLWRVLDLLMSNGVKVEVAETEHPGHATELAREAAREGRGMVVAAGGDGTIAEVANGLIGSPTALGVIPLGTANVLAKEYGLPSSPRAVANMLAYKRTRLLWPGIARLPREDHVFVQMAGLGFDGAVVHGLPPLLKRVIGRGAYVWQSVWESLVYGFPPLRVIVDGEAHEAASVVVSKGRLYGGSYLLAPEAKPEAPGFQVVLFERSGTLPALLSGAALPLGILPRCPGVRILPASHVEFPGNARSWAQCDGDALEGLPFAVTNAPAPISLITG
ncbi:diacylglycerol/lipid kinase family protein [Acidocella aromatica]|uniref:YegS/Rv2252/BmrU family lipid kinase n=1 Tax=Acidocella aromatica TaxID=1303579 RepID=A0A840VPA1_9PROT|nr:diacylglycerol kinase family protein [Acidocella aromatica]MBB5373969.1 YegS/Rv2252/BmrU family lipid kinase [Acidocella aromatica]